MRTVSTRPMWYLLGLCTGLALDAWTTGLWLTGATTTIIGGLVALVIYRHRRVR